MWIYRTGSDDKAPVILYDYQPSRNGDHAVTFLKDFKDYVHSDGYNKLTNITRCGCRAHLRRKFVEAISNKKDANALLTNAETGREYCNQLFKIEESLKDLSPEELDDLMPWSGAVFLAYRDDKAIAFAQCGLRYDYVEGTESRPVGYLEGIFVVEEERLQGVARQLKNTCLNFAKEQGGTEFVNDCELENDESLRFHLKMGFAEANRIICFTKKL